MFTPFILLFALITLGWNSDGVWRWRHRDLGSERLLSYEFTHVATSLLATLFISTASVVAFAFTVPGFIWTIVASLDVDLALLFGVGLFLGLGFWFGKWVVYLILQRIGAERRPIFWLVRMFVFVLHQVAGPLGAVFMLRLVIAPAPELLWIVLIFGTLGHFIVDLVLHLREIKMVYWSPEGIPVFFLVVAQVLFYIVVRFFSFLLGGHSARIISLEQLRTLERGKTIIAANHRSWWDVFNACMVLPPSVFIKLAPFRFMTKDAYVRHLWQKIFMVTFGGFPAKQNYNQKGLELALALMRKKQTIFVFPEGRIIKAGMKPEARIGVAYLACEMDAQVLPIYMEKKKTSRGLIISVGEPLLLGKREKDLQPFADSVLKSIYGLSK